jgi:hypothetical protein
MKIYDKRHYSLIDSLAHLVCGSAPDRPAGRSMQLEAVYKQDNSRDTSCGVR